MHQYDILRKNHKAFNKRSRQAELSSIVFENSNIIVNLQAQLTINNELLQKQTKIINKHRTKRAAIDVREKKMNAKLTKMIQELNAYKKENSQNNIIDKNVVTTLSFASQNLNIDTINLIFQKKLNEIALFINKKKFFDALVFSKVKSNE